MRLSYARFVIALAAGALTFNAWAQLRPIPADAKRATLDHLQGNVAQLDDKQFRLAPGALIRDTNNVIILPTMVPSKSAVRYQLDNQGMLSRVWLLSPQEAAQTKPAPKPTPKPGEDDKDKDSDK